jgi:hypothetical protein
VTWSSGRWRNDAERGKSSGDVLSSIVDFYLRREHRSNSGSGCVLPSLAKKIPRRDADDQEGILRKSRGDDLDTFQEFGWFQQGGEEPSAFATLSVMLGALMLGRTTAGENGIRAPRAAHKAGEVAGKGDRPTVQLRIRDI